MDRPPTRHNRPNRVRSVLAPFLTGLVGFACGGLVLVRGLDARLDERAGAAERLEREAWDAMQGGIAGVREDLAGLREAVHRSSLDRDVARRLDRRLHSAEERLGLGRQVVEAQATTLAELEEDRESFGPDALEAELAERDARLLERWENLRALATTARALADESQRRVEEIAAPRDLERMWRELVGPVVQIAGDSSVGSGVLLPSRPAADGEGHETYLLTAWHVVRDIQGGEENRDEPVTVSIYENDGSVRAEEAGLVAHEVELDAALLVLRTPDALENGAALASPERLGDVRIFDEVYAVGCPLGNDPIPTRGEVATCRHRIDGETYWMINAPTYIGNSGGGIFDSETHELLGIFSKIYTHGSLRPTIVPHMGLVTPLSAIYDWLEDEGHLAALGVPARRVASAD